MVKSIRAVEKKTPNDLNILKHYGSSLHSTLDEFFIIIIIIQALLQQSFITFINFVFLLYPLH